MLIKYYGFVIHSFNHKPVTMKKAFTSLLLISIAYHLFANDSITWLDKNIVMKKLSAKAWLIQSSYSCNGQLDCNHLLIADTRDIVLVNTPATDSLTNILIQGVEKKFHRKITRVIVSHFHDDSSGGLKVTTKHGIISYSLDKTRDMLKPQHVTIDQVFSDSLVIPLQTVQLKLFYPGAGHSADNIVTWLPEEKILFGGCLMKSMNAMDKGNIKDADLKAWPVTVQKVRNKFSDAKVVIPGHGAIGDAGIFDHTIDLVKMN